MPVTALSKGFVIENRELVAYALIMLMAIATIVLALFMRHNSRDEQLKRDARRVREEREAKHLDH
ncbi:hypothetical protein [Sphingomonas turrisvirgatae]|uniref:hypothetical protein n=1 Tax=Sphingomonas turrisvirgatae TaxID=1888892 RepID=UPI00104283E0|nr:hypothetical protein [Sphingomonas turrisvirgatae]